MSIDLASKSFAPKANVRGTAGQTITGVYVGVRSVKTQYGQRNVYGLAIEDGDMPITDNSGSEVAVNQGDTVEIPFPPTVLDRAFMKALPGQRLKVTYLGLGVKKKGQNAPHLYKLEVL